MGMFRFCFVRADKRNTCASHALDDAIRKSPGLMERPGLQKQIQISRTEKFSRTISHAITNKSSSSSDGGTGRPTLVA